MPKVNWGIKASDVDEYDPNQFRPYDGPIPPSGVYEWQVKFVKFAAATDGKLPQLRAGLELIPRRGRKDEKQFAGYFIMAFMSVSERTQGFYVPFLSALGVSGRDFEQRTIADQEGNIQKIGAWRNTGDTMVKGELKDDVDQNGNPRKRMNWFGPIGEAATADDTDAGDEEEWDADEDYDDEDYDDDDDSWEEDD